MHSDVGAYEVEMGFKAGADIVTTHGINTNATIQEVKKTASQWQRRCEVDTTGVEDVVSSTKSLMNYGVNLILFHRSINEEITKNAARDSKALNTLDQLCKLGVDVGVAGGIHLEKIPKLLQFFPLYAIVIGRGITAQADPATSAKAITQKVRE